MIRYKRSIFINLFKFLFIFINFFLPAIIILWGSSKCGPFVEIPVLKNITFILLFFLVFPVTITYLVVSLNRIFPDSVKNSLKFFIPYILNLLIYSIKFGFSEGFLYLWMIQSLPLFLGYIIAMVLGFLALGVKDFRKERGQPVSMWLTKGAFVTGLSVIFILSFYYMCSTGVRIISSHFESIEKVTSMIYFFFSIILVFVFHYGLLKILYKEGKL